MYQAKVGGVFIIEPPAACACIIQNVRRCRTTLFNEVSANDHYRQTGRDRYFSARPRKSAPYFDYVERARQDRRRHVGNQRHICLRPAAPATRRRRWSRSSNNGNRPRSDVSSSCHARAHPRSSVRAIGNDIHVAQGLTFFERLLRPAARHQLDRRSALRRTGSSVSMQTAGSRHPAGT